ncbi:MAG: bifunctional glycosyltransferase/class I SAM-dependent methyltransferase [Actinobacteria bacterium]|nr:bifunctional glycosyltransferase/class I SAM-dependent methyltransferase [Actinomycetota bacterium]
MTTKKIGILVVAYNAATTLAAVLDRIPEDFRDSITSVIVGDDHSQDQTHLVAVGYQQLEPDLPLQITRHESNLGYGGNQKWGYRTAIDQGLDIIVLLHGDGQYAPELLPQMVAPLLNDEAEAVFGSRMMLDGGARRGGMPMYKFVGNRILTTVENAVAGVDLTEWHSGYRAYSVAALAHLPFERNSDGFDFDTQIILQLIESGQRIAEIPIPTYYGEEISHVNGLKYAKDITSEVVRYRAHKMGFGTGELAFSSNAYEQKQGDDSSHHILKGWLGTRSAARVLDLGCSDGRFAEDLQAMGHHVTGVDLQAHDGVTDRVEQFVQADLDQGLPSDLEGPFEIVLAADVLEHVRRPDQLLQQIHKVLAPGGSVLVSVPNFGHWYPRLRVALGRFDYDRRGILDSDHVRFFTKKSFERLALASGFSILRRDATGLPLEVAERGGHGQEVQGKGFSRLLNQIDRAAVSARPQLFGYQFLFELRADSSSDFSKATE